MKWAGETATAQLRSDRERILTIKDIGPSPQSFDLENATLVNTNYRVVAWSGKYLQLTLMSIPVGEDIGLEAHPETDQFLRLDAGRGRVQMGPTKEQLDFDGEVLDASAPRSTSSPLARQSDRSDAAAFWAERRWALRPAVSRPQIGVAHAVGGYARCSHVEDCSAAAAFVASR